MSNLKYIHSDLSHQGHLSGDISTCPSPEAPQSPNKEGIYARNDGKGW